jgi:predicted hydrocarbon binding protein
MENVFLQHKDHSIFSWENLGNIKDGRGSLGEEMPVLVYRLMQFTMFDIATKKYGKKEATALLRESGHLAGTEFARNALNLKQDFDSFSAELQAALKELKVGILRIESVNTDASEIVLTVGEDLDCSGLPVTGETVCDYDEGFIAGILEVYTKSPYNVKEIDCWASGDRICRFRCSQAK